MASISDYTSLDFIKKIESKDKFKAIEELAHVFKGSEVCSDVKKLTKALKEREEIMSTGIGFEIAIPHAKIDVVNSLSFAVGLIPNGIDFDSMDGKPVKVIILAAAGEKQHKEYLALLSSIMTLLKDEKVKDRIIKAETEEEAYKIFKEDK